MLKADSTVAVLQRTVEKTLAHRNWTKRPDGSPDDEFDYGSIRGATSYVGWLGTSPVLSTRAGLALLAVIVVFLLLIWKFTTG